jgi:calcium-dependent protein kinase
MYKLFSGVNHLHSKNVVHRDLKPENFLFTKTSKKSEIKIIDFGLSAKFDADFNRLNSVVGTPYFVAPEVLAGSYSKECDVWSLGVIMYILLSGEPPFNGANPKEVFRKVMKVDFNFELAVW